MKDLRSTSSYQPVKERFNLSFEPTLEERRTLVYCRDTTRFVAPSTCDRCNNFYRLTEKDDILLTRRHGFCKKFSGKTPRFLEVFIVRRKRRKK